MTSTYIEEAHYSDGTIFKGCFKKALRKKALGKTLHREDGPAIEYKNGDEFWYKNGKLHREDGPATESEGAKSWFLKGINIGFLKWFSKTKKTKEDLIEYLLNEDKEIREDAQLLVDLIK